MVKFKNDIEEITPDEKGKGQCFVLRTPEAAYELAGFLAEKCKNYPLILLGLRELLMNAIEHGNLEIGFEEKGQLIDRNIYLQELDKRLAMEPYSSRMVALQVTKKGDEITFVIVDEGKGFDPGPFLKMASRRIKMAHGRGIALANNVCFYRLSYNERGNVVECAACL